MGSWPIISGPLRRVPRPFRWALAVLPLFLAQCANEGICDLCTASLILTVSGPGFEGLQDSLRIGVGRKGGSMVEAGRPSAIDSGSTVYKVYGGTGEYAITLISGSDSTPLPKTYRITEKQAEGKDCNPVNTVHLDIEITVKDRRLDKAIVKSEKIKPEC